MVLNKDFVSYLRASTTKQGIDGYGIDAQRKAVNDFVASRGGRLLGEYVEVESGKARRRPQLEAAIQEAKKKNATLAISKLDRLARSVFVIAGLIESQVDFVAVDMPDANKLTIHIFSAMGEYERDLISQRTKAGLAAAKARGVKLGCPIAAETAKLARKAASEQADYFAAQVLPMIRDIQDAGKKTLSGIADALNRLGVKSARGGRWYAASVKRVLDRATA